LPAALPGLREDASAAELQQPAAPLGSAASSSAAAAKQTSNGAVCTPNTLEKSCVF